jgi:hypothetical protein
MNRDPVIFDEPHGYYGPAAIHHGDRTFDVTAELHIHPEEHGRLSWSGILTGRTTDASTALYQLRRDQFTLDVADRSAQCAGTEVRLIGPAGSMDVFAFTEVDGVTNITLMPDPPTVADMYGGPVLPGLAEAARAAVERFDRRRLSRIVHRDLEAERFAAQVIDPRAFIRITGI